MASLSRRDLIRAGGGVVVGGMALSACSFFSTEPKGRGGSAAAAKGAKEAPMLAERVKAGDLPPLAERLPKKPLVVEPIEGPGVYGGILQRGQIDREPWGNHYMEWAGLLEWSATTPAKPSPGLAESWEVEDGGRTYVFHLREGVRWSDGKPFTTDDLMFTYEHIYQNEELTPVPPEWLVAGGKTARFVQVDERTIRMEFAAPQGLLLKHLCFIGATGILLQPKHYMTKFHKEFIDKDELRRLMKKHKTATWQDLFEKQRNLWQNTDYPVLGAWRLTKAVGAGSTARIERNPYYWKVDTDGRQLPYIDGAVYTILSAETLGLRGASGRIDLDLSGMPANSYSLLLKNQESESHRVLRWAPDGAFSSFHLNQSHPDPVLRKLFQDIEFRAGLSKAINREEMNQGLLAGQGIIQHPCGQEGDRYFEKGMGQTFIEYDVDAANEHLDNAGLKRRGKDGMRLRPDGKRMQLVALTFDEGGISYVDVLEYVKRYAAKVGIDIAIKQISHTLWYEQTPQGDYDIAGYSCAGYLWDIDPLWYVPVNGFTYWAPKYGQWYADPGGKWSMEPDGDIRKLQTLYDELKVTPDEAGQVEIGREILRLHDKNVWIIGSVQAKLKPFVVSDDLANVRAEGIASFRTHYEGATNLAQIYFKNPEQHT